MSKIDERSWNAALDAAATLFARGYHYIRRPFCTKTMTYPVEIKKTSKRPCGEYLDWVHCSPDEKGKDVAAILSLKRRIPQ